MVPCGAHSFAVALAPTSNHDPVVEIYILRHADAEAHDNGCDRERALTNKGREQARRVGRFMCKHELVPDCILSSPFARSWQTAEIVCEEAGLDDPTLADWLSAGVLAADAIRELTAYQRFPDVLIVGHQPGLSELIAVLIGLPNSDQLQVRKAELIALELDSIKAGSARLLFCVPVQMME